EEKAAANALPPGQASGEFITNLLPPTTEGVCCIRMQDLQKTALGRAIFDAPGAFDARALQKRLGFMVDDIDLLVLAWHFRENWALNILHTPKPMQPEVVKAALRAKAVAEKEKIADQEYYVLERNSWMDQLGQSSFSLLVQTNAAMVPKR